MSRPLTSRDRLLILLGSPAQAAVVLAILLLIVLNRMFFTPAALPAPLAAETVYPVRKAVDKDTLLLEDGTRVRLIGVDAPGLARDDLPDRPFDTEAAQWLDGRVSGKQVRLEFDFERYDRYGITLAYVYLDEALLNEEIIRYGYGRAQLEYNYSARMKKRFQAAEDEARQAMRGIWTRP